VYESATAIMANMASPQALVLIFISLLLWEL
jgi:hypothetical protein